MTSLTTRIALQSTALAVTVLFAFHAVMVALFNLPGNYLSAKVGKFDAAYMNPYFQQSWSLFAPSPGDFSTDVSIRYAVRSGGTYRVTPWLDGNSIFPRILAANPLSPLALEREIYFSETLITTNAIQAVRKFNAKHHNASLGHPIELGDMPDFIAVDERFFMSLEPALTGDSPIADYRVQLALREIPNPRFGRRFGIDSREHENPTPATLLLPWVHGRQIPSFVSRAVIR